MYEIVASDGTVLNTVDSIIDANIWIARLSNILEVRTAKVKQTDTLTIIFME